MREKASSHELAFGIEKTQYHITLISEPRLSTSLSLSGKTELSFLRLKARCDPRFMG